MLQYGEYTRLLLAAQADTDPAHRQIAMDALAVIGPRAGSMDAGGRCPGDELAAPMLALLYPPPPQPAASTRPATGDELAAIIAKHEAIAQAALDDYRAQVRRDLGLPE